MGGSGGAPYDLETGLQQTNIQMNNRVDEKKALFSVFLITRKE
jgi:hypothetical protein